MRIKSKLVYGVGINDADYPVQPMVNGKQKICPYYRKWRAVLERCYSPKTHLVRPSYVGCSVCEDWLRFSKFKAWMEQQDWEGKHLDKDLLIKNNKIYSPETCTFISTELNSFLTENGVNRGNTPIGVSYHKRDKKYAANISCGEVSKFLGYFATMEEAHQAWLKAKLERVKHLIENETNPIVSQALVKRYSNYSEEVL